MTKPVIEAVAKTLIINEKNEVLILTVGEYKGRPDKSFMPDLPGGRVDPGETGRDAAIREAREEVAIALDPSTIELAYTNTKYYENEHKSVTKFLYVTRLAETPEVRLSWEHEQYAWVPLAGLRETVALRPFYKEAVAYCFEVGIIGDAL